jgi:hypothetical protein
MFFDEEGDTATDGGTAEPVADDSDKDEDKDGEVMGGAM